MKRISDRNKLSPTGLRTRFFPKNRIGQGLISVAPWVDMVLILILFVMLDTKMVTLQPGIVIDLPKSSFSSGTRSGMVAIVSTFGQKREKDGEEIIFFNDERYKVGNKTHMTKLRKSLAACSTRMPNTSLIIKADKNVQHGTIIKLCNMAKETGIREVNLAVKTN